MSIFDFDRASEARKREPIGNLNEMLGGNFTEKGELKINDQATWFQLKRIANSLEAIEREIKRRK